MGNPFLILITIVIYTAEIMEGGGPGKEAHEASLKQTKSYPNGMDTVA